MIARRLLLAAQLSLLLTPQLRGQNVTDFDRVVTTAADEGQFAGVVLVQVGGEDVYVSAVGDAVREFGIPHDRQTRFKFHSLTKPIVSVALYSLVADGRVELQAPICRYLEPCPPEWAQVEVRHLLNHSSGLPELENGWFSEGHGSLTETYAAIMSSGDDFALVAEPGTTFRYSNGGYTLLSRIIEIADARAIEDVIRDRVFLPSGMASAGMERAPAPEVDPWYRGHVVVDRLANGYNGTAAEVRTAYSLMYTVPGAGGVYGTVDDLAAFASALFGGRLIPDDLRRRMLTPVPSVSERYADGWVVREREGHRYFAHTGGTNGFLSSLEYYPDAETTIVVLSNLGFAALGDVASGLAGVALDQRQE